MSSFPIVFQRTLEMLRARKYVFPTKLQTYRVTEDNIEEFFGDEGVGCKGYIFVREKRSKRKRRKDLKNGKKTKKYNKVMVSFQREKMGITGAKAVVKDMEKYNPDRIIFIIGAKLTSQGKAQMKSSVSIDLELFTFDEMRINAVNHRLVPRHELLTEKETKKLISNVGNKIPGIKRTDVISKYYCGKPGQIFRIYRQKELYYRMIIR